MNPRLLLLSLCSLALPATGQDIEITPHPDRLSISVSSDTTGWVIVAGKVWIEPYQITQDINSYYAEWAYPALRESSVSGTHLRNEILSLAASVTVPLDETYGIEPWVVRRAVTGANAQTLPGIAQTITVPPQSTVTHSWIGPGTAGSIPPLVQWSAIRLPESVDFSSQTLVEHFMALQLSNQLGYPIEPNNPLVTGFTRSDVDVQMCFEAVAILVPEPVSTGSLPSLRVSPKRRVRIKLPKVYRPTTGVPFAFGPDTLQPYYYPMTASRPLYVDLGTEVPEAERCTIEVLFPSLAPLGHGAAAEVVQDTLGCFRWARCIVPPEALSGPAFVRSTSNPLVPLTLATPWPTSPNWFFHAVLLPPPPSQQVW